MSDKPASGHVWYVCQKPCEKPACMFCEGGLGYCTVCKGFEGSLPTQCPGTIMGGDVEDLIYNHGLDFRDGTWCRIPEEHWFRRTYPQDWEATDAAIVRLNKSRQEG